MKRIAGKPRVAPVVWCVATLMLAGCAGGDNFFTAGPDGSGSKFGNLIAFNTTQPGPVQKAGEAEQPIDCPVIEVLDGTASLRTFVGTDRSNNNVRYQFSMGDVVRECSRAGDQILIKVGVEGRVLLGPAGAPGSFVVPVRVAIRRDKDQKAAAAQLYEVPAAIAPGQDQTMFQLVTDPPLSVPFTQYHADNDYTVLVGFDDQSKPAASAGKGKRVAKPAPG